VHKRYVSLSEEGRALVKSFRCKYSDIVGYLNTLHRLFTAA